MSEITAGIIWAAGNVVTETKMNSQFSDATIDITQVDTSTVAPIGMVIMMPGSAPTGNWLYCDGTAVSRSTYSALFAYLGITCGQGDGTTTFNLPDYRGRFIRGTDGAAARDPDSGSRTAMGTGGNTGNNVNSVQDDAFESHTHNTGITFFSGTFTAGGTNRFITFVATPTSATGGNETRPVNAYINYYIHY